MPGDIIKGIGHELSEEDGVRLKLQQVADMGKGVAVNGGCRERERGSVRR